MEKTSQNSVAKERIYSFDFLRALCAVGIIVFHYSCKLGDVNLYKPLYFFENGNWGNTIVNIFFLISGTMLYYNNDKIVSNANFYYKRYKAIFPMFYLTFIPFYIWSAIGTKNPFYGGNPIKIILSIFGLDGYFVYRMDNYYQVGEWFLGAIIILYALYPLIIKSYNKSKSATIIICMILYATVFLPNFWLIDQGTNLFSCLISFIIGIALSEKIDIWRNNKVVFLVAMIISVILVFFKLSFIPENISIHILALSLYISLVFIGERITRFNFSKQVFKELSAISYAVFLLQHKIICKMLGIYLPNNNTYSLLYLLLIIVVILTSSKILNVINSTFLKSKPYMWFESAILKRIQ